MAVSVHATAIVSATAQLGEGVEIGPYSIVDDGVCLGAGTKIGPFVQIHANTKMGRNNQVRAHCAIGGDPEDLKYDGEPSFLEIGNDNSFHEAVTINRGTKGGGLYTRVGDGCLFQNKSHVGHDCQIFDQAIICATTALAGHVTVESRAILGGGTLVHQFCRIGSGAMTGAGSIVLNDVLPYALVTGQPSVVEGANVIGLRRRGLDNKAIKAISNAIAALYGEDETLVARAKALLSDNAEDVTEVRDLADFVINRMSQRGLMIGALLSGKR